MSTESRPALSMGPPVKHPVRDDRKISAMLPRMGNDSKTRKSVSKNQQHVFQPQTEAQEGANGSFSHRNHRKGPDPHSLLLAARGHEGAYREQDVLLQ